MTDYLSHALTLSDSLAIAGSPISEQELILFILGGSGAKYENLVISLTTRADSITLEDLQGQLYTYELRCAKSSSLIDASLMANVATKHFQNSSQIRSGKIFRGRGGSPVGWGGG